MRVDGAGRAGEEVEWDGGGVDEGEEVEGGAGWQGWGGAVAGEMDV